MSKKKEINLKSTPAAVESGDVNISYNNVLVGSLSDSGSAVLKTEMTICEHDIELEYTKSATAFPALLVTIAEGCNAVIDLETPLVQLDSSNNLISGLSIESSVAAQFIPNINLNTNKYIFRGSIYAESDDYTVTVNNEVIAFGPRGHYTLNKDLDNYMTEITINVSNKV